MARQASSSSPPSIGPAGSNKQSSTSTTSGARGATTAAKETTKKTPSPTISSGAQTSISFSSSSFTATSAATPSHSSAAVTLASGNGSQTSRSSGGNKGFSGGALAGAIVASLIGAGIITFLATFLFLRSRQQGKYYYSRGYYQAAGAGSGRRLSKDKTAVTKNQTSGSETAAFSWQPYLPQSADDRTIQNAVKTLFDQVELHVDNFYKRDAVDMDNTIHQALVRIDTGKLPGPIDDLIQSSRLILPVIKHCIADLLVSKITPSESPQHSLLPPRLSTEPSKLNQSSISTNEGIAANQAYSHWKLLNAYLFPHPEEDPSYNEKCDAVANWMAELVDAAFLPWQAPNDDKGALEHHEKSLVTSTGHLGILIMSQPLVYEFRWSAGDVQSGVPSRSLIVFPGFWKVADEDGRLLDQPQLLVSPNIVRV